MAAGIGPSPFNVNNLAGPALDGFAIVPSDSTNFNIMCRTIYVGGTGDVTVVTSEGTVLTFKSCPVGLFIPVVAVRVNATGTSATQLVALV